MKKQKYPSKKKIQILVSILLTSIIFTLFCGYKTGAFDNHKNKDIESSLKEYEEVLNKEEQDNWKSKSIKEGNGYIQINTKVDVDKESKEANIRLINPPYCEFDLAITITLGDLVLYQSDIISPATVLETIKLDQVIEEGQHEATVNYSFYDTNGEKQGEYVVNILLLCQ